MSRITICPRVAQHLSHRALMFIACLGSLVCASSLRAAPVQWTVAGGGNGHYYDAVLVPDGISWADASTAAATAGGYLATITSAAEGAFILDLADDPALWIVVGSGTRGPWLGGLQADGSVEPGGGWQWVTGEAFAYTNWAAGEPNNNLSDENSLHLYYAVGDPLAATWNDLSNESGPLNPVAYVVESVPEPSSLLLALIGLSGVLLVKRRR